MDTWLLALDCLINLGILGWLVFEYKHPASAPAKVVMQVSGFEVEVDRHGQTTRVTL